MAPFSSDDADSGPSGPGSDTTAGQSPPPPPAATPGDTAAPAWARAVDWDRQRATITELYRDRGMRLEEVVATMAREHAFYAK